MGQAATVEFAESVKAAMGDGVILGADIYLPHANGPVRVGKGKG